MFSHERGSRRHRRALDKVNKPYTLNLNPTPYTLASKPYTLNPQTLHPQLQTLQLAKPSNTNIPHIWRQKTFFLPLYVKKKRHLVNTPPIQELRNATRPPTVKEDEGGLARHLGPKRVNKRKIVKTSQEKKNKTGAWLAT